MNPLSYEAGKKGHNLKTYRHCEESLIMAMFVALQEERGMLRRILGNILCDVLGKTYPVVPLSGKLW